jgi:signal peptidase I
MDKLKPRKLKKQAKYKLAETELLLKRGRRALSPDVVGPVQDALEKTQKTLKQKNWELLPRELEQLEKLAETHLAPFQPNRYWETIKALLIAVAIALFIRWLFIEPFRIPSGSMVPTLLFGDQLMVNKFVYGPNIPFTTRKLFLPRAPRRGEVIVFKYPHNIHEDYIKRAVGLPGDEVMIADGNIYINGDKVEKIFERTVAYKEDECGCFEGCDIFTEQLGEVNHPIYLCHRAHTGVEYPAQRVPEGHLFAMGDNRDTSFDSRGWGYVPFSNLKGKAMFIHLPLNPENHYLPRWNRFFQRIK